jgi:hypothetical protein
MIEELEEIWDRLTPAERKLVESLISNPTYPDILGDSFPCQTRFIKHKSKMKALLGTRRMAKSYTAGLYLLKTAIERKGTSSVYIGLTRDQAKRIMWQDVFKSILQKYGIAAKYNETELTITLDNGSIIYILGVDDSEAEKDKLLGKKYALCIIDEAASYTIDLHSLIYKVLKPACSDLGGTICLIGTPDDRKGGIFYELTRDVPVSPPQKIERMGWTVFTWTTNDNPFMRKGWEETIAELKAADPFVEEQSWFQQHYLGKWTVDDSSKIYRYNSERNAWDGILPDYGWKRWNYVLGIDLGFADATAFALLAYHENDPHTYIVKSDKWRGLTITDTANKIREWMNDYPIDQFVVDGANRQAVEEIVRHHGLPLQAADKRDKVSFIRIMNSSFVSGKLRVYPPANLHLIEEWDKTIWNKKALEKGIYKEDGSYHPDAADAALYAYRFCYSYASVPLEDWQRIGSDLERERAELNARFRKVEENENILLEGNDYLFS